MKHTKTLASPVLKSLAVALAAAFSVGATVSNAQTPVDRTQPPRRAMTTEIPASITTPDVVETSIGTLEFFDGVPTENTTETVYDYVDRARAVEVFINLIPAVSMYHIRQGSGTWALPSATRS